MWSNKYIGIPYKARGRDDRGVDCWGLVRLVYAEQYNISLPSLAGSYDPDDQERIGELMDLYREGWEETGTPEPGDIVLFRIMGEPTHLGVVVENNRFIHSILHKNVAVENLTSLSWSKRIIGYYRYKAGATGAVMNAAPHPLKTQRYTVPVPPGTTVSQLASWVAKEYGVSEDLKKVVTILINGKVVPEEHWDTTCVKEGDVLEYRAVPQGGDNGIFRMFLMIALVVATQGLALQVASAVSTGMGLAGAGVITSATAAMAAGGVIAASYIATAVAVNLVGSLLINAIAPIRPPEQKTPQEAGKIFLSTGSNNRLLPYEPIPVVLGKVRMTPPFGAEPVSRYQSETDSYLDLLLIWGYGPLRVYEDTLKVGDTPLGNYIHTQETITYTYTPGSSEIARFNNLYGRDINQETVNIPLTCEGDPEASVNPGPWINTSITVAETDENGNPLLLPRALELAIAFPQGLRKIKTKGKGAGDLSNALVRIDIQINYSGSGWISLDNPKLGGPAYVDEVIYYEGGFDYGTGQTYGGGSYTRKTIGTDSAKKDGFVWYSTYNLPSLTGTVQVRMRRTTGDNSTPEGSDYQWVHQCSFQTAKIITNVRPAVNPPGCVIAKTALTIKSTDQLNGNLEGINAVVQTYCLSWNGLNWVMFPTSNPADLFRYVLTHPANPRRILESEVSSKIDLSQLQYWAAYCTSRGFEYNSVEAGGRSIMEVLRDICAAGRASPALVDGRWTVVIDEPRSVVVQHFTPHNSWGFEGTKAIPQLPDAFRVNYIDQDQEYQQAEIIVPFPGKDVNTAALFETIELPGVTKKSNVQDHVRWHIAQIKLRPEVYTLNTDIEYLVCNRGDRVKVTHDVPLWGLGSGRIKDIVVPQQVYDLDEQIYIEANKNYTVRIRSKTGQSIERTIDRQFNIIQAQKVAGGVRVTVNESHSVIAGNYINVASNLANITGTGMLVTEVTSTTITYEKSGPFFNTGSYSGTVTLIDDNYTRVKLTPNSSTDLVDAGDLFLFGELNQEAQDLIVLGIEPLSGNNARITLMDYGVTDTYNIFTDYPTLSPAAVFETQITLPPEGIRKVYTDSQKPTIIEVYSGFESLERFSPGIYEYNIKVTYLNLDGLTSKTRYVECQYNFVDAVSNNSAKTVTVPYAQGTVTIPGVREGVGYKIRLRYLTEDGAGGPWTAWYNHVAQGLIDADNLSLTISVDRVTRFLEITPVIGDGSFIPEDFKTYEFKVYKNGGDPTENFWDSTDPLIQTKYGVGPVRFNLREFNQPRLSLSGVQYRIACRVIDVTDRYISSPAISSVLVTSLV